MTNSVGKTTLNIFWRILQIIFLFVLVGGILATVVGAMLGISMVEVAKESPEINPENILMSLDQNSKIYDKNGNLIESIAYEEYREIVDYEQIPENLINAFIAVEDERFKEHKGVDPIGIVRSLRDNIVAGGIVQGASTITQQLVKNVYLSNEVEWDRKITEMYLALQVENMISKDEIMNGFLNRVYFGQHAYGVEAAAQTYFSKPVSELNLAQSATLASIVQSPSNFALFDAYPPASVPEDAEVLGDYEVLGFNFVAVKNDAVMSRKDFTLQKMLELKMITQEQYDEAINFDVMASVKPTTNLSMDYPSHISNLVKNQAIKYIMASQGMSRDEAKNLLYTGGLSITTTIDWDIQAKLEEAYDNFSKLFSGVSGRRQPLLGNLNYDELGDIVSSSGQKLYYKKANILTENNEVYVPSGWYNFDEEGNLSIKSSRLKLNDNYITILPYFTINDNNELVTYKIGSIEMPSEFTEANENGGFTISSEFFNDVDNFYTITENDNLVLNSSFYTLETSGTIQPQSSTVILDSKTAEVVAMVSKRGESPDDTIDRATGYFRPVSSSIKPIAVYAPAIEEGRTLADPIDDTPYEMIDGKAWPKNVYNGYRGIVTTREALLNSMNPPAVKILNNDLGIEKSKEYLRKFGIIHADDPESDNFIEKNENLRTNDENLSMGIGSLTKGFTPMDMASAYQTFANNGKRIESSIISSITSENLGEIYVNKHEEIPVISEQTNFLISDVMHDIAKQDWVLGNQGDNGMWNAGKTGTSNGNKDFWFAGFNNYYTAATWIGFDNQNLGMKGSSGNASQFYFSYMNKLLEGKENVEPKMPENIVSLKVSKLDGKLPSKYTSLDPRGNMIYTEYFIEGTQPKTVSTAHVSVAIDRRNNLLAPRNLPDFLKTYKVFVERPIPYNPNEFGGIKPDDWGLEAPKTYSNLPIADQTTTKTLSDGTVVQTTTKINGNVEVLTSYNDGSVILQVTTPNGKVTTILISGPTPTETEEEVTPEQDFNSEVEESPSNEAPSLSNNNQN